MANANIEALYVGSLRIKKNHISFPSNLTFYKWCVTKVAHCTCMFRYFKLAQMIKTYRSASCHQVLKIRERYICYMA